MFEVKLRPGRVCLICAGKPAGKPWDDLVGQPGDWHPLPAFEFIGRKVDVALVGAELAAAEDVENLVAPSMCGALSLASNRRDIRVTEIPRRSFRPAGRDTCRSRSGPGALTAPEAAFEPVLYS